LWSVGKLFFSQCDKWGQPHKIISNTLPLTTRWQFETEDPILFQPQIVEGTVFLKTSNLTCFPSNPTDTKLIALDAVTGKKLWDNTFVGWTAIAPVVTKDAVATPINAEQAVRGLDKATGQVLWEFNLPKYGGPIRALSNDEQYIYVAAGLDLQSVYALDAQTGTVAWAQSGKFPPRQIMGLFVESGQVIVVLHESIFVLDSQTGNIEKQYGANLATTQSRFSYDDDTIYVYPEGITAVDWKSGLEKWTFSPKCIQDKQLNEGPERSSRNFLFPPTPIGEKIYTTGGCHVIFALNKESGSEKWVYDNDGKSSISQIAPLNGLGYVMFNDRSIRAIDLETGQEEGRLTTQTEKPAAWAPGLQGVATAKDMLYFSMGDRVLYAFGE
jgi:outer membrane protein assembly factor BamB